ncbi:hypothetical protein SI65_04348 [Aspergillus cristatus]|uniref:Uncharacterized protein n=1 Tax=Aspergillus cristatus TaxID=573508 RepID=A0A1E3BK00_ASPCR|nr:hypothetical protein SI65_04348 [Aspergillus cristatus]
MTTGSEDESSNALHCAAHGGVGYSTEEERIEVLAWLLEKTGIDINQWKHEFSGMESWRRDTMETALQCAVGSNALGCVRFLLEKGIDAGLRDFYGKTARDLAVEMGNHEAVKISDGQ